MDEWLKSHIAFILPCAYACYAVDGELSRTTVEQRRMIVDAAWECCEMLKAAGVPVNDAENTDRYREGTKQRKKDRADGLLDGADGRWEVVHFGSRHACGERDAVSG